MNLNELQNLQPSSLEKQGNFFPIFTSYYAIRREIKTSIKAISVSIQCPDHTMEQLLEVAPDEYTLKNFKNESFKNPEAAQKRLEKIYKLRMNDMLHNGELERLANKLQDYAKEQPVILFCYEKSEDFCHRHILADTLNKHFKLNIHELMTPEMIMRYRKEFQKTQWEKTKKNEKNISEKIEFVSLF